MVLSIQITKFIFHNSNWEPYNLPNLVLTKFTHYSKLQCAYSEPDSVLLRTVPELLTRAWLTATYRACLWSIIACSVTSSHSGHIQATAARPHDCNNRARFCSVASSNIVPKVVSQFVEWKAKLRGDTRRSVAAIVRRSLRFLATCERLWRQNVQNGVSCE